MSKILLLPLLLFVCFNLQAQTKTVQAKAIIKGRVIDSLNNTPIEFATVAILDYRDTTGTLLSYTITDKAGAFNLHNIPRGIPIKVFISFVAYQQYRKIITTDKTDVVDLGTIKLNIKELNTVTVTGERMPIVIRKDTIEFNAEAFKVRPNAVVEDLLKKLPGMEVSNDGSITVMGKAVSKVLVDGHEFFSGDTRMATKNIDADMIDKIQVYDDRDNDPDHLVLEAKLNKIVNLKFKKKYKKSIFGKGYGGAGTSEHYQAGGLVNSFRDTLQISVLGSSNNLNSTGFDFNDLYTSGGLDRGGEAIQRAGLAFGGGGSGRQKATSAGVNINTDYGKKLKINLAYVYKSDVGEYNSVTRRQQFLTDTILFTNSATKRNNDNYGHSISSTVVWQPNDKTRIRYTPYLNINSNNSATANAANSFSNFINPVNNSANTGSSSGNTFSFSQSFNYNKQLKKKGASINIDHSFSISPRNNINYDNTSLTSYITAFPSYSFRQLGDTRSRNTDVSLSSGINYPLTKAVTVDLTAQGSFTHSLDKISTYDYNPVTGLYDSFLLEKSSDLNRDRWMQTINPGVTINLPKDARIRLHFNTQFQQVNNMFGRNSANLDQQFVFFMPNINFSAKGFSASYNRYTSLPNIGDLVPYTVVFSPSYSVTGNPNLKPATSESYNLNYSKYNFQKGISYNFNASAGFSHNSVFRQRTLDAQLVETSTPINRDGRYNLNAGGYINKQVKKEGDLKLSLTTNFNISKNHDFFVLNRMDGFQDSYRGTISEHLSLEYKEIFQIDPTYSLNQVYTTYTGFDYNNQKYLTHNVNAHFTVYMPFKANIDGTYNYSYNPLVPAGFQKSCNLLNLSLARQFLKNDRGEIKLSCYDLLNQNIDTYRSINQNSVTDTQSQIIRRYFLLTLQFKFTKSTVKSDDKQMKSGPAMIFPSGRM
ncbi:outer membrane beta-barrel protein [Mucilaginibacter glaciei]|uniref:Outer membrane beta-barrel protein n=1 Tax=Mucilaginibacter glaciei TaxID=2772109 RepID=A0A926NQD0_9SPHI|nr:outer membrane beta-barrel protein [Mucilaginibacter glaciei]MBD1393122.1 outer membrane beta-barrel protein [Mucilaginibacter glaciei]